VNVLCVDKCECECVHLCSTSWDEISPKERKLKNSNYVGKTHHFISRNIVSSFVDIGSFNHYTYGFTV